jgi:hypothetical protein
VKKGRIKSRSLVGVRVLTPNYRLATGAPVPIPANTVLTVLEEVRSKPARRRDAFGSVEVLRASPRVRVQYRGADYWLDADQLTEV